MTAGTVVITGGILATVILLCIIAVLCYCRLQYYCCKKDDSNEEEEEEEEEEEPDLPVHSHLGMCNACNSHMADGQGSPTSPHSELNHHGAHNYCPTCSPYGSPFYIRTANMVRNGGERVTYTPTCCKEMGPPISMATLQSYPVSRHSLLRESFPNPRAISTEEGVPPERTPEAQPEISMVLLLNYLARLSFMGEKMRETLKGDINLATSEPIAPPSPQAQSESPCKPHKAMPTASIKRSDV